MFLKQGVRTISRGSMPLRAYQNKTPKIASGCFIAPSAEIIGDVGIGEGSSVWFNATIRADLNPIRIGKNVSIQDNCTVHVSRDDLTEISDNVVVGHGAIVHGAKVGSNSIVGMGAILLNGSKVGKDCIIGAGSVVTEGTEIPDGSIALGTPCKVVKPATPAHIERIRLNVEEYSRLNGDYLAMESKGGKR
jgi:carbonic anhydrase/acetyltransferase-like protein (isoleucine patch superfamily)